MSKELELKLINESHLDACCEIEAQAFNELRTAWDQPLQKLRRLDWFRYFIEHFPENNLVVIRDGEIIGSILSHKLGSLGWIGPIVVSPKAQGAGLGQLLTNWSIDTLKNQGCTTISLETWAHNILNIGFYVKLGFIPTSLVLVMKESHLPTGRSLSGITLLETGEDRTKLAGIKILSEKVCPGFDYTPFAKTLLDLGMGKVIYWGDTNDPDALAIIRHESYLRDTILTGLNVDLLVISPGREHLLNDVISDLEAFTLSQEKSEFQMNVVSNSHNILSRLVNNHQLRVYKTRQRLDFINVPIPGDTVNFFSYAQ